MCIRDSYIAVNATGGAVTVNLPSCSSVGAGRILDIKDANRISGTNNITLDGNGVTDTIDGAATHVISENGDSVTIVSDGITNWEII